MTVAPASLSCSSARGSAPTRHSSACSTAPADARNVAGESGAAWCSGQIDRRGPEGDRGADDGAEVLRILDLVEGDDDGLRVLGQALEHDLERDQRQVGRVRDRALMPRASCHAIELEAIDARHRRAAALCEARDRIDLRAALPHEVDLLELVAVDTDRLANRLESRDQPHALALAFHHCLPACATPAIALAIARAAASGSSASRMGRPTTTQSAPSAIACSGVATRF